MIDKFDYAEPSCPLCDGGDFYNPKKDAPLGRIPVSRIIEKVDACFNKNDYLEAGRLLEYWLNEAVSLKDKKGELAITSELIGYYRKQQEREKGIKAIERALVLVEELNQTKMASCGTIYINCATAYKAFDMPNKALPLYEQAERTYEKTLKADDEKFGGLYNNKAITLVALEKYEEAEKSYLKALDIMSKIKNGEPDCAITYINLAHMLDNLSDMEKAISYMKKAQELLESPTVKKDGYLAFVLEKCAPSFEYFGFIEIAERMKKESKEIYERARNI